MEGECNGCNIVERLSMKKNLHHRPNVVPAELYRQINQPNSYTMSHTIRTQLTKTQRYEKSEKGQAKRKEQRERFKKQLHENVNFRDTYNAKRRTQYAKRMQKKRQHEAGQPNAPTPKKPRPGVELKLATDHARDDRVNVKPTMDKPNDAREIKTKDHRTVEPVQLDLVHSCKTKRRTSTGLSKEQDRKRPVDTTSYKTSRHDKGQHMRTRQADNTMDRTRGHPQHIRHGDQAVETADDDDSKSDDSDNEYIDVPGFDKDGVPIAIDDYEERQSSISDISCLNYATEGVFV